MMLRMHVYVTLSLSDYLFITRNVCLPPLAPYMPWLNSGNFSENLLCVYNMHPFLRRAFLGQNCAYYMQDFTVIFSLFYHTDPFHLNFYLFMYCICKCFLFLPCLFCEMTRDNCHTTWMICHPPPPTFCDLRSSDIPGQWELSIFALSTCNMHSWHSSAAAADALHCARSTLGIHNTQLIITISQTASNSTMLGILNVYYYCSIQNVSRCSHFISLMMHAVHWTICPMSWIYTVVQKHRLFLKDRSVLYLG